MIKSPTKKKLLANLERSGNVTIACLKSGVNRATFYRWKQDNDEFRDKANEAEKHGRESNCDIAEQALMLKIKERDMNAIKYLLGHNSPRYKGKETSKVLIVHRKESAKVDTTDELYMPEEIKTMNDEETLQWLNSVITDLNEGKASGKYFTTDNAEL